MNINQLIKGIIIGIAKIIPGLSGAVLMISFNLYDRAIDAITNFFSNPKKNFIFLFNLGLGIVLGIVLFSKIIYYFISKYYLYTMFLFIGLIFGGVTFLYKNVYKSSKYFLISLISFVVVFGISTLGGSGEYVLKNTYIDYIVFFIAGFLEAIGTVMPGVSSTALLMMIGVYNYYLVILSGALNIFYLKETLSFIIPFSLGMIIGIIILTIIINYLFKYHKAGTYSMVLGISFSSIFTLTSSSIKYISDIKTFVLAILMFLLGFFITNKLE